MIVLFYPFKALYKNKKLNRQLHIICNEIPKPFDTFQGNDLYWMIKSLQQEGIQPHLHVFQKDKFKSPVSVNSEQPTTYYEIKTGHCGFSFMAPFGISSYYDKQLISTLNQDKHPIIFHGIEATFNLSHVKIKDRKVFVRIMQSENLNPQRGTKLSFINGNGRWYDFFAIRKSTYETRVIDRFPILVAHQDMKDKFDPQDKKLNINLIPNFIGIPTYLGEPGDGSFCLFHGNLDNSNTTKAAHWLLDNVFNKIDIPLVIAGSNPSKELEVASHRQLNTCLVANPTQNEKMELIKKAQVNILPGLINDLQKHEMMQSIIFGRHILSMEPSDSSSHFKKVIHFENDLDTITSKTKSLFESTFPEEEKNKRESFLQRNWLDASSTKKLIKMLY